MNRRMSFLAALAFRCGGTPGVALVEVRTQGAGP